MALDTETKGKDVDGFLLGCIKQERRKSPLWFYEPDDMFNYLLDIVSRNQKNNRSTYIYAHSHAFDFYRYARNFVNRTDIIKDICEYPAFYYLLDPLGFDRDAEMKKQEEKLKQNGEKKIRPKRGYLLDTLHFYKMPLAELGKLIGKEKLPMPEELTDENKEWSREEIDKLKPYCYRDTEIVYDSIPFLSNALSNISHKPKRLITAGAIAMNFWITYIQKKEFMSYFSKRKNDWVKVTYGSYLLKNGMLHRTNQFRELLNAYKGARNEAFQTGVFEGVTMLDLNSIYPYALSIMNPVPDIKKEVFISNANIESYSQEYILKNIGVVNCNIKVPDGDLMYLPVRFGKCQLYPHNRTIFEGSWSTFELSRALELGYEIEKINHAVIYPNSLPFHPFKEYMNTLYNKRIEADSKLGYTYKLMMNSLYGKFCQYRKSSEKRKVTKNEQMQLAYEGYKPRNEYPDGTVLMVKEHEKELSKTAHPIFAIYTTAIARDILYNNLKKIPFDDLLYTDSDSIMFKGNHLNKFKINKEMGNFKIEFQNAIAEVVKEKRYRIEDENKEKTVYASVKNRSELTSEQLWGEEEIVVEKMKRRGAGFKDNDWKKVGAFYKETIQDFNKNPLLLRTKRDRLDYLPEKFFEEKKKGIR